MSNLIFAKTSNLVWKKTFARHRHIVRAASSVSGHQPTIAIRREDASIWERRCPLAPQHVKYLVSQGIKVIVQPSNRRAYPMQQYVTAGAIVDEEISDASLIMAVKQPLKYEEMLPNKTYSFFSHTIKAQEANMSLLDAVLEKKIRLIDYECMTNDSGARLVAFGKYAGVAGMLNILHGLGLRLLALGHHTPFMHIGPPHNYRNGSMARAAVRDAGYEIALGMMPKSIGPLTFIFTGSGNVSKGAQEVFQDLPHEFVLPEHLPKVAAHGDTNKIYGCVCELKDNVIRRDGRPLTNSEDYFENPSEYASVFNSKIAPYASLIINGIYWAPGHPRLITIPDAKQLLQPQSMPWLPASDGCPRLPHRLLAVCDISADPGGSMEFVQECTTINHPFCLYDAEQHKEYDSFSGAGVLVCSIDNMPTQLPTESTDFFGSLLLPYVVDMMKSDADKPFAEYSKSVSRVVSDSVIASNGQLTPKFQYIDDLRQMKARKRMESMTLKEKTKKVLVLGSGYVSAPVIEYLSRDATVSITLASKIKGELDLLSSKYPDSVEPKLLDVEIHEEDDMAKIINDHDLVISLLPYELHHKICAQCIKYGTHMITASYLNPQLKALHESAVDRDVTVMNEVGLDPGIDHLLAVQCFDGAKEHGATIDSFVSYCGGLPAPEDADNPLMYKFSWSPRGVLLTALNAATFRRNGKVVALPADGRLLENTTDFDGLPAFNLECYPNRNSLIYGDIYQIQKAQTILRGTLRYKGFSQIMLGLIKLGLLSTESHPMLHPNGPDVTWKQFMCSLVDQKDDIFTPSLKEVLLKNVNIEKAVDAVDRFGLLEGELIDKRDSPLDTLAHYLNKRLVYQKGERDLVVLHHNVGITWPDRSREERHIDLVVYGEGEGGYTAMAKTVGYPTAIAAKMMLEGEIQRRGMVLPITPDIYRPMLQRLRQEGIVAKETSLGDDGFIKERLHKTGLSR